MIISLCSTHTRYTHLWIYIISSRVLYLLFSKDYICCFCSSLHDPFIYRKFSRKGEALKIFQGPGGSELERSLAAWNELYIGDEILQSYIGINRDLPRRWCKNPYDPISITILWYQMVDGCHETWCLVTPPCTKLLLESCPYSWRVAPTLGELPLIYLWPWY